MKWEELSKMLQKELKKIPLEVFITVLEEGDACLRSDSHSNLNFLNLLTQLFPQVICQLGCRKFQ